MSPTRHIDYIIVGQGLAGSSVVVQLLRLGKKILVIDQPEKNRASRVAAGLFNPVTGKKMTKTWMADTIFPYLHQFYRDVESVTGRSFFYPMPLYRPFLSVEEQNEWMGRSSDDSYRGYISDVFVKPSGLAVNDRHGGLLLKQCGYVDTPAFIDAVRSLAEREGYYENHHFDEGKLVIDNDGIEYGEWRSQAIIFCQGTSSGKLFDWLPVKPLKGETITISSALETPYIVNRGVYVVPARGKNEFRVGATYDYQDTSHQTTAAGKVELENRCGEIVQAPFTTISQDWGLRPTVPDRRPLLGRHPTHGNVAVFNGLGTKGVSLAPYFSGILIRSLENHEGLNNDVNVNRYKSVY